MIPPSTHDSSSQKQLPPLLIIISTILKYTYTDLPIS